MTNQMKFDIAMIISLIIVGEILAYGGIWLLCDEEDRIASRIFSALNVIAVIVESVILYAL